MKFVIFLAPPTSLTSSGPCMDLCGRTGTPYPYQWNPKYERHILFGKELGQLELDQVAQDIFAADHTDDLWRPVPMAIDDPAPTAEELLAECTKRLPDPADRVKLGLKLVSANRKPRRKGLTNSC